MLDGDTNRRAIEFAEEFRQLVRNSDPSSRNSQKNKPLEALVAERTGWPSVAVKYIGEENKITNRFGEARKKVTGASPYLVVLAPDRIFEAIVKVAEREISRGNWSVVALGSFGDRATVAHVLHASDIALPTVLTAAFPAAQVQPIEVRSVRSAEQSHEPEDAGTTASYSLAECAAETGLPENQLQRWLSILRRKKQMVFQGPPGSGKTFVAKRLARAIVSGTGGRVEVVQFHPSLNYEDFVQGIRPSIEQGQITYSVKPGRFMRFCDEARDKPDSPFVLLIDELNRGNLSRIFGELMYLLEYRGESIALAQGDGLFAVPQNLFILATMNTADRSIALVDHALRRRFSFVFLGPDYDHLERWLRKHHFEDGGQLVGVLKAINQRIDDRHYHLGTSYFLSAGSALRDCLADIWVGEIEPHLQEYFFDQPTIADEYAWSKLAQSSLSWWAEKDEEQPLEAASEGAVTSQDLGSEPSV